MIYFKIDGSGKLEEFGVGNAGIIPKVGEIVNLKIKDEEASTSYDVTDVRYFYEHSYGLYVLKGVMITLTSI